MDLTITLAGPIDIDPRIDSPYLIQFKIEGHQRVDPYLDFILPPMSISQYLKSGRTDLTITVITLEPNFQDKFTCARYDLSAELIFFDHTRTNDYQIYHRTRKKWESVW